MSPLKKSQLEVLATEMQAVSEWIFNQTSTMSDKESQKVFRACNITVATRRFTLTKHHLGLKEKE